MTRPNPPSGRAMAHHSSNRAAIRDRPTLTFTLSWRSAAVSRVSLRQSAFRRQIPSPGPGLSEFRLATVDRRRGTPVANRIALVTHWGRVMDAGRGTDGGRGTADGLALRSAADGREGGGLLHRWFVQYNPLYFASALLVLAGLFLVATGLGVDDVQSHAAVAGIAQLYQFLLIGAAWRLLARTGSRRPATRRAAPPTPRSSSASSRSSSSSTARSAPNGSPPPAARPFPSAPRSAFSMSSSSPSSPGFSGSAGPRAPSRSRPASSSRSRFSRISSTPPADATSPATPFTSAFRAPGPPCSPGRCSAPAAGGPSSSPTTGARRSCAASRPSSPSSSRECPSCT